MPKLRKTVIRQIFVALENSEFSLRDYKVEFENTDGFVCIQFLPFPEYEFTISEKNFARQKIGDILNTPTPNMHLVTIEAPSEYKVCATLKHNSINHCINRISNWCKNIAEELAVSLPTLDFVEEFEVEIEKQINDKAGDSKERFTQEEIENLTIKLDTLASKFSELEHANSITEQELVEIKQEVDRMKFNLPKYPKSTWYKISAHKILDVMKKVSKSEEGKDILLSSAKKLLGLGSD
ncbi:hypothetical protein JYT13_01480 [Mariprofundus ferrooxydans]|nr:hypothetical protein [Mariprofundus ferrooxydans]